MTAVTTDLAGVETDKCHFFYGGVFSQWYPSKFVYKGIPFSTAEQFMMFGKAMVFHDKEIAEKILATTDPREQKRLGREVKGYTDEVWDEVCFQIVFLGNFLKFTQNPEFLKAMYSSATAELYVEASPSDKKWGIGIGMEDPRRFDLAEWKGDNLLGLVITYLRELLVNGNGGFEELEFGSEELDDAMVDTGWFLGTEV